MRTVEMIWIGDESNQRQSHRGHLEIQAQWILLVLSHSRKSIFIFPDFLFPVNKMGMSPCSFLFTNQEGVMVSQPSLEKVPHYWSVQSGYRGKTPV